MTEQHAADMALIAAVRVELARVADPAKAEPMRAYMKSSMPYLGASMPQIRAACRSVFAAHPLSSADAWRATILTLWRAARYREERHAATELASAKRYRAWQTLDMLPIYEEMIVTGAWWDHVDGVGGHLVGGLLRAYPTEMSATMRAWSGDMLLWKRRASIICQLDSGAATDEALLFDCITPNLTDREFFIRKAIGWALRQYARVNPDAVRRYVAEHAAEMSALSRREALKHLAVSPTQAPPDA